MPEPRFAVTPTNKVGLVTNDLGNGKYRMMVWGEDESYEGEATIQSDDWSNQYKEKFLKIIDALKDQGSISSFF